MAEPRWWHAPGRTGKIGSVGAAIAELQLWVKVMQNRSRQAARFGRLVEEAARRRYDLKADHTAWCDARAPDGRPIEVKGAMLNRRSGKSGRFRVFEAYHDRLRDADGAYVFVAYVARGRGIQVRKIRSLDADALQLEQLWTGAGGHRDSRQAKIPVGRIF